TGFAPPVDVRADRITVDGKTLRYVDDENIFTSPASSADFASINGVAGTLVAIPNYFAGAIIAGVAFGQPASGIEPDQNAGNNFSGLDAFVFTDGAGTNLYPPTAGTQLTAQEVTTILQSALAIANKSRAQIRRPLGSQARVSISVVDTDGSILGIVRARDAPIFGTDVSLQKARTAVFFSSTTAAADLTGAGFGGRVTDVQNFVGASALTDGIAFSDRSGGNLSRPFYPDGIDGNPNGPFSNPFANWSPFSVGLQLELVIAELVSALGGVNNTGCGTISGLSSLDNGIQIFPGSVPIYRGNTLIGGIGVSGDGVDQDDMISFLGVDTAGQSVNVNNAPVGIRADTLSPQGVQLRYVQCPQTPFLNSNEQNVCAGK
ncbi:MAG: heme-binding protein, partial [Gammaproteobacteria bacterium]